MLWSLKQPGIASQNVHECLKLRRTLGFRLPSWTNGLQIYGRYLDEGNLGTNNDNLFLYHNSFFEHSFWEGWLETWAQCLAVGFSMRDLFVAPAGVREIAAIHSPFVCFLVKLQELIYGSFRHFTQFIFPFLTFRNATRSVVQFNVVRWTITRIID